MLALDSFCSSFRVTWISSFTFWIDAGVEWIELYFVIFFAALSRAPAVRFFTKDIFSQAEKEIQYFCVFNWREVKYNKLRLLDLFIFEVDEKSEIHKWKKNLDLNPFN